MKSQEWLKAAIALANDPTAKVTCPVCEAAVLVVRDVYPSPDADVFERYLECPNCEARNILRMRSKRSLPSTP